MKRTTEEITAQKPKLSKEKGTYLLFLSNQEVKTIKVGSLGKLSFQKGFFIYVGSARGPGGLEKRIHRHLKKEKKIFWHIDNLLSEKSFEVLAIAEIICQKKLECEISQQLSSSTNKKLAVIEKFGSSDCRCKGHLFYIQEKSIKKAIRFLCDLLSNYPLRIINIKEASCKNEN